MGVKKSDGKLAETATIVKADKRCDVTGRAELKNVLTADAARGSSITVISGENEGATT